jgi:chromosome segregation ATPase
MQTNRRRADLLFKIDTFVEKKNCSRCYRLHKKYAAENKLNTLDTTKVDLENNIANLQQSLEQQKQAYQILQEQFEQIKSQNFNLQNMNMYLSQALSVSIFCKL